jgi:hypothetical protein
LNLVEVVVSASRNGVEIHEILEVAELSSLNYEGDVVINSGQ